MTDPDTLKVSREAFTAAVNLEERLSWLAPTDYRRLNVLAADYLSKLRECEECDLISDDVFLNGLAEIEHYLWTGKVER